MNRPHYDAGPKPVLLLRLKGRGGAAELGPSRRIPRKRGRRPPPQVWPAGIALGYFADLREILQLALKMVQDDVLPELPRLLRLAASERGDSAHQDAVGDDIDRLMDRIARRFWDGLGVQRLEQIGRQKDRANRLQTSAHATARKLATYQQQQLDRQLRAILGIDLMTLSDGGNIQGRIAAFVSENVALIKSIPQQFFDQVEARVIAGVTSGRRASEIADEIQDRFKVSESRAALIANDQVGKFYGKLNEVRQQALGIDGYIWRTVGDDRVRLTHRRLDGTRHTWDDPPDVGHPGEDYNCRCYPEPDVSAILSQL